MKALDQLGVVMAGAVLAMLPSRVVFVLPHEQFTGGFAPSQGK